VAAVAAGVGETRVDRERPRQKPPRLCRRLAGESAEEYRETLADLELQAAKRGTGIWAHTDWDALPAERRRERDEARELNAAVDGAGPPPGFVV
jgi:hypothetical protein